MCDVSGRKQASVGADIASLAEGSARVNVERESESAIRYRGAEPMAIGVELVEVAVDSATGGLRIKPSELAQRVRGAEHAVFLGDPDGDAFVEVA